MKQYMLAVHYVDGQPPHSPDDTDLMFAQTTALNQEMQKTGVWVFAGGLRTPDIATVVTVTDGRTTTTDGPFAEAKEHIGGFWVLRCADLDEALAWAEKASVACMGPIEVRPFDEASSN
jgi:hypothetical protein